jgi:hypothetical protein
MTLIGFIWFVGFIIMSIIWFMSRPKNNVTVYGPQGQQVSVSEKEAANRVKKGWTYHLPTVASGPATFAGGPPPPPTQG